MAWEESNSNRSQPAELDSVKPINIHIREKVPERSAVRKFYLRMFFARMSIKLINMNASFVCGFADIMKNVSGLLKVEIRL